MSVRRDFGQTTCPRCGWTGDAPLNSLYSTCPHCGYDFLDHLFKRGPSQDAADAAAATAGPDEERDDDVLP